MVDIAKAIFGGKYSTVGYKSEQTTDKESVTIGGNARFKRWVITLPYQAAVLFMKICNVLAYFHNIM